MALRSQLRTVALVTAWEFRRFFKLRDVLITLGIIAGGFAVGFGGVAVVDRVGVEEVDLALYRSEGLPALPERDGSFRIIEISADELAVARERVGSGVLTGLIEWHGPADARLLVRRDPLWVPQLRDLLQSAYSEARLEEDPVLRGQVSEILRRPEVEIVFHETGRGASSAFEALAAIGCVTLMLLGVFLGFSYQFTSITGEKRARVTELIVSTIQPQAWIDGKILGITAICALWMFVFGWIGFAGFVALRATGIDLLEGVGIEAIRALLVFSVAATLGLLFWNSYLAAIAATINDPLSSTRSHVMMAPVLAVAVSLAAMQNPGSWLAQALALFPPTAPAALPVRMIMAEPPLWEVTASLLLLVAGTWFMRRLAGVVFGMSILIHGAEPGWREVGRWLAEGFRRKG